MPSALKAFQNGKQTKPFDKELAKKENEFIILIIYLYQLVDNYLFIIFK